MDPPFLFLALLPVILAVVLAEISEGGMDARVLAILGVLSAVNAVLRGVSAGTAGLELVFFLLILGGRVFGPGFGFVLGCTSLFASALMTAGVGPWLPFQMLVAGWVGMFAGLLPRRVTGRGEIVMLDRVRRARRLRLRTADEPLGLAVHPRRPGARPGLDRPVLRPRSTAAREPPPVRRLHRC